MNSIKTIVIATISYQNLTGVELYIYELSKELSNRGKRVVIIAPEIGGDITLRTQNNNVEVYSFENCPDDINPDILHLNEDLPTMFALSRWPLTPAVLTLHSQFQAEKPFVSPRISTYICIRKEIVDKAIKEYKIPRNKIKLIYNGFDFNRFQNNLKYPKYATKDTVLFVGTIDSLRRKSIEHLIKKTKSENKKLIIMGKKHESYLDRVPSHVTVLPPSWDVEKVLHKLNIYATAGVLLGRTTIEGWIAGLPGIIYDIDLTGNIKSVDMREPPRDIMEFSILHVTDEILKSYEAAVATGLSNSAVLENMYDLSKIVSAIVSRSTTQGIMLYGLMTRSNSHEDRINHLELGSTSLHDRVGLIEKRQSSSISIGKIYRFLRKVVKN